MDHGKVWLIKVLWGSGQRVGKTTIADTIETDLRAAEIIRDNYLKERDRGIVQSAWIEVATLDGPRNKGRPAEPEPVSA